MKRNEIKVLTEMAKTLSVMASMSPPNPCYIKAVSTNLYKLTKASAILRRAVMEIIWSHDESQGCSIEQAEKLIGEADLIVNEPLDTN